MDTERRLLDLLGGINFKVIDGKTSVAEFKKKALYNQAQYAEIEARGAQYQERLYDLICLILADKLYPFSVSRFGDTSDYSLHRILREYFETPEMKSEWTKCKQLALQVLNDDGIDGKQTEIFSEVIDDIPEAIIDLLVWIIGRLKVVPLQETGNISKILVRMMKEGGRVC